MGDVRAPRAGDGPGHEISIEGAIAAIEEIGRAGLMTESLANTLSILRAAVADDGVPS